MPRTPDIANVDSVDMFNVKQEKECIIDDGFKQEEDYQVTENDRETNKSQFKIMESEVNQEIIRIDPPSGMCAPPESTESLNNDSGQITPMKGGNSNRFERKYMKLVDEVLLDIGLESRASAVIVLSKLTKMCSPFFAKEESSQISTHLQNLQQALSSFKISSEIEVDANESPEFIVDLLPTEDDDTQIIKEKLPESVEKFKAEVKLAQVVIVKVTDGTKAFMKVSSEKEVATAKKKFVDFLKTSQRELHNLEGEISEELKIKDEMNDNEKAKKKLMQDSMNFDESEGEDSDDSLSFRDKKKTKKVVTSSQEGSEEIVDKEKIAADDKVDAELKEKAGERSPQPSNTPRKDKGVYEGIDRLLNFNSLFNKTETSSTPKLKDLMKTAKEKTPGDASDDSISNISDISDIEDALDDSNDDSVS